MKIHSFSLLVGAAALMQSCSTSPLVMESAVEPPAIQQSWVLKDPAIQNPESAHYDPETKILFVSNVAGTPVGKDKIGWITKVDPVQGKILTAKWVTGLNAPKGMRASKGRLWVSDIDHLVEIEIKSGRILRRVRIPGAKFLNDVAVGPDGEVYVSDMMTGRIHVVKKGKPSLYLRDPEGELPNGLLIQDHSLLVASWGTGMNPDFSTTKAGNLSGFDLKTKQKILIGNRAFGNLDGLEADGSGGYFISDWMAGRVYWINQQGEILLILNGKQGTADLGFIPETKTLIVPQMMDSEIQAYLVK